MYQLEFFLKFLRLYLILCYYNIDNDSYNYFISNKLTIFYNYFISIDKIISNLEKYMKDYKIKVIDEISQEDKEIVFNFKYYINDNIIGFIINCHDNHREIDENEFKKMMKIYDIFMDALLAFPTQYSYDTNYSLKQLNSVKKLKDIPQINNGVSNDNDNDINDFKRYQELITINKKDLSLKINIFSTLFEIVKEYAKSIENQDLLSSLLFIENYLIKLYDELEKELFDKMKLSPQFKTFLDYQIKMSERYEEKSSSVLNDFILLECVLPVILPDLKNFDFFYKFRTNFGKYTELFLLKFLSILKVIQIINSHKKDLFNRKIYLYMLMLYYFMINNDKCIIILNKILPTTLTTVEIDITDENFYITELGLFEREFTQTVNEYITDLISNYNEEEQQKINQFYPEIPKLQFKNTLIPLPNIKEYLKKKRGGFKKVIKKYPK